MQEVKKISPKISRIIDCIVANPKASRAEIAQQCQVSCNTMYWYYRSPLFIAELDNRLREQWKDAAKMAQSQMISMAENGDYRAVEFILKSNGYAAPEKIEVSTDVIRVSIED